MSKVIHLDERGGIRNHRRRHVSKLWIIPGMIVLILLVLNSPLFSVREVTIEGNERISDETIMDNLEISLNMNLFRYCVGHLNNDFDVDPLVDTLDVYIEWPDAISITVTEKSVMGYIPYMGLYLCIDTLGCVLDSVHEIDEGIPLLTGVTVQSFSLGEAVDTEDTERFTIMLSVLTVLEKYELLDQVDEISVSDAEDIHLYIDDLDVSMGSEDDLDRKVAAVVSVLEDEDRPSGILHIEDLDGQVYIESSEE